MFIDRSTSSQIRASCAMDFMSSSCSVSTALTTISIEFHCHHTRVSSLKHRELTMLPSPLRTSTCHTKNQKGAIKPVLFHWKAVLLQHSSSTCWRHAAQPSQQPTHASQAASHSPSSHTCCGHSHHCSNSNTNAVWSKKTSAACCLPHAPTKCHVHCPSHPGSCSSAALTQPCIPHIGEHAKHKQFWQASPTLHAATPPATCGNATRHCLTQASALTRWSTRHSKNKQKAPRLPPCAAASHAEPQRVQKKSSHRASLMVAGSGGLTAHAAPAAATGRQLGTGQITGTAI